MRQDMIPGSHLPDYELTDHTGSRRQLTELEREDPRILVMSRGHFCSKDHQQHLDLTAFYPKLAVACRKIITITTDALHEVKELRSSVDPLLRSLTFWGLGLVLAALWLSLLLATNFSMVVLALGLLVSLAMLNGK